MLHDEDVELIILDDEDGMDDYRNARRRSSSSRSRSRGRGRRGRTGRGRRDRGGRSGLQGRSEAGDILRKDTGGLSTGKLVEAGAQILAAIQPLPSAPAATLKLETDLANMVLYQKALAEHAKRDEQLRTVGSLASKLFA